MIDYKMPNMNGIDLANQLRSRDVAAPIILITGYPDDNIPAKAAVVGVSPRPVEAPSRGEPRRPDSGRHSSKRVLLPTPVTASGKLLRDVPLRYRAKYPASTVPDKHWPSAAQEMANAYPTTHPIGYWREDHARLSAPSPISSVCLRVMPASLPREFSYRKDEEIYGEDEPADYVYQVIQGAVRTYKLLSDGRRQIGAFHLPGDVFGLESRSTHRLAAEAIVDTTVRLVEAPQPGAGGRDRCQGCAQPWTMTAGDLRHAEDHMLLLGRKSAMERVANFLLEMDRRLAVTGMMALPMCRRDIGDYLG